MKKFNLHFYILLFMLLMGFASYSFGQLNFTVNSLADDSLSYPWDNPDTPDIDESTDGICKDEAGRCTLNAALGEASSLNSTVDINFSVTGTINLSNTIYLSPGSTIDGGKKIKLHSDTECMSIDSDATVKGLTFSAAYVGLTITGRHNKVGVIYNGNTFLDCYTGLAIDGDSNEVYGNYFGIDSNKVIHPNTYGLIISGSDNQIGYPGYKANTICGSGIAGITVALGEWNRIEGNMIGTTIDGEAGFGNKQGIVIEGSEYNVITTNCISGNELYGIFIGGAPPEIFSRSNFVTYNIIGLEPLHQWAIPNGNGIVITNGTINNGIKNNYIAGNNQNGILIFGYDDPSKTVDHVIDGNKIGVNDAFVKFPNGSGISIVGNVENIVIGTDQVGDFSPNTIIGNLNAGITVKSGYGFSPKGIVFRKNIIKQNGVTNLVVDTLSNNRIKPPFGLSLNGNTLAGIHDMPNALIDVYKANRLEGPPSAYEWLGSTTTAGNGVFSFDIIDPFVEAVSVTATITTSGHSNTSAFALLDLLTGIDGITQMPMEFALKQNYPNPFNPTTKIKYSLPEASVVTLSVYNILGMRVSLLVDGNQKAGYYEIEFNAAGLPSGTYIYRLKAGSFTSIKKLLLLK